jgi:6-phosphofructokinase 1
MDACEKINRYMKSVGHDCRVIGIPKTIDNDLSFTDHAPGYGSAAKFVATTMMEISQDAKVYDTGMITVVEIMGRNAGWLAAAASLANEIGCGPDLIYLPERRFDMESFLSDVEAVYKKNGNALVAVSEGIRNKKGTYVMELAGHETARDVYGHAKMGGLASYLASLLKERTGAKVRGVELSLLQRCAAHLASATDVEEAYNLGCSAVNIAARGISGVMVALRRVNTSCYKIQYVFENLERVANYEHKMPKDWINESGNGVTCEFVEYALPLIAGDLEVPKEDALPRYARLKFIPA